MDVTETAGGMDFSGPRLRPWQEDHGGPRGLREWHRFMAGKFWREPFGAKGAHFPFIIVYMYSICTVYTSTVYIIVNLLNLVPGEPVGAQSIVKKYISIVHRAIGSHTCRFTWAPGAARGPELRGVQPRWVYLETLLGKDFRSQHGREENPGSVGHVGEGIWRAVDHVALRGFFNLRGTPKTSKLLVTSNGKTNGFGVPIF